MASVLEVRGLSKHFGGVKALQGVDFRIESGEVVCLLGENGAGKSTLVSILAGLSHQDSGSISLDGEPVDLSSPRDAKRIGIELVPQELSLVPDLTVRDNVMLAHPRSRRGFVDRAAESTEARRRLESLGLGYLNINTPVSRLRTVDQVFVQIARSLAEGTRFLIADEPTAPMSGDQAEQLTKLLKSISKSGVGVIFVSHRLGEVATIGDRVEILRDGRNSLSREMAGLTKDDLVNAMIGEGRAHRKRAASSGHGQDDAGLRSALEIRDLSSDVLHDVEISVPAGRIVGVYGTPGSGREVLGEAITGLERASGIVSVDGKVVERRTIRKMIKSGVGFVPGERRRLGLVLAMSITANITMSSLSVLARRGMISRQREAAVGRKWIENLSIRTPSEAVPVGSLSGGGQQKVLLARWLQVAPSVLILSDPTRGVDVATKFQIYEILRDFTSNGGAVLLISSDAEELELSCDEVYVMHQGTVVSRFSQPSEANILSAAHQSTTGS